MASNNKKIFVTHVTIRQSISILLSRLIILEIIFAAIFVLFHPVIFSSNLSSLFPYLDLYSMRIFFLAVAIKLILTIYIVLSWLNEYYEISPALIKHRKGIIFVKKEQLALEDIQTISLEQGIIGKILNFGTLSIYDWKWKKYEYLYAIHNPLKYIEIIENLLPNIDEEKNVIIREHLIKKEG